MLGDDQRWVGVEMVVGVLTLRDHLELLGAIRPNGSENYSHREEIRLCKEVSVSTRQPRRQKTAKQEDFIDRRRAYPEGQVV